MTIIFAKSDFLFELFPQIKKDYSNLKEVLIDFYSISLELPKVEIDDFLVKVTIDLNSLQFKQEKNDRLIRFCENGNFDEALPLAKEMTRDYPEISEFHRILGQIYSEINEIDEAINSLIDALKWNPKNESALIMMGNVFARYKNDLDTAMIYYNEVIELNPNNNNIALNNIGANLMQIGKDEEAREFFNKALLSNPYYPNTYFGLALMSEKEKDYKSAFEYNLKCLQNNPKKDQLYNKSISMSSDLANNLSESESTIELIQQFVKELQEKYNTLIKVEESNDILTAATIEFKENHNRDFHLVKYQGKYQTFPHLVIHELLHLELAENSRKNNTNQLFISNESHKSKFLHNFKKDEIRLQNEGVTKENIEGYLNALFYGINQQIFNTPIDLFIEDIIFTRFANLRPIQFYSLFVLLNEGIEAVTRKDIVSHTPKDILSVSKIYNLVNALHFKTLFGLDFISQFNPTKIEVSTANRLYSEFIEYREDRFDGEEYELVQHWAEDLKMDGFFDLILESKYRNQTIESVLNEIADDPLMVKEDDSIKKRKMSAFIKSHTSDEVNLSVVMYMVDAIEKLKDMDKEQVKKIAFEFAMVGMSGIDPNKDGYHVPSFPNSSFSGYKTLAYYYTSWAIAIPEKLVQLEMPFDKEYKIANEFLKKII